MFRRLSRILNNKNVHLVDLLRKHFGDTPLATLSVTTRTFVFRVRADLQIALSELLDANAGVKHFSGVRSEMGGYRTIDFGALTVDGMDAPVVSPPEYEPVDVGDAEPVRCLKSAVWLIWETDEPCALLMNTTSRMHGDEVSGIRFYFACQNTAAGIAIAERFFRHLENAVRRSRSYRGKVLSLESENWYSGRSSGIKVHRLASVAREELILPASTVELLDRNVIGFCKRRAELATHGLSMKKGLLFYGPPGTGKTHTIRYLAGVLPDHTTLLITAEQVGLLPEYMTLARLLSPSIVVIEDADLIARDRTSMGNACSELMLNGLLNEMDGLKEDAQVMFILTTNRPQMLEAALAARPGRVDQAIEFPLPDAGDRRKLVHVYGRGMEVSEEVTATIVARTQGVSASFIKELMRRSMQFCLERGADPRKAVINVADVNAALEEILFKGGSLNASLLGGAGGK